jgi:heme exporter protein A
VGLEKAKNQLAQEFSTGMRVRLKLAIALQPNPDLLLLDEPGAGLDEQGRELIEKAIQNQLKKGAVILATNDPAETRFANMKLEVGE